MDVKTAYLHGELAEEIYNIPPKEVTIPKGKVWRLNKSMYGLKQSDRSWNKKLDQTFAKIGLIKCKAGPCIYYKKTKKGIVIVVVYVDDLLIFSSNVNIKNEVKR